MEDGFYASCLADKFGLEVIVPSEENRKWLDSVIYNLAVITSLVASSIVYIKEHL